MPSEGVLQVCSMRAASEIISKCYSIAKPLVSSSVIPAILCSPRPDSRPCIFNFDIENKCRRISNLPSELPAR